MLSIKIFFENINFTFGTENSDIKPSNIIISENQNLTDKIKNKIFIYSSPKNANTSFYIIATPLPDKDLFEIRRFIWNENKYELYFITETQNLKLCYAKSNPRDNEFIIDTFKLSKTEKEEIEKIKKWKFDSGAFWMDYSFFLERIKNNKRIDKELIFTLKELKAKLKEELKDKRDNSDKIVQALIDRTLFIKFLEDNYIINSFFYNFYFPNYFSKKDTDFGFKKFLIEHDINKINILFEKINEIFSNVLFETPTIKNEYLTGNKVLDFIYQAISKQNWDTGQLSLFDFRFNVIPIEFISHIYEVFLEGKQLDEGIYYTPTKLTQLIVDEVIDKEGKVLDPACGSGMFLILAFRKLLKINTQKQKANVSEKISYKINILKKFIFGIEKDNTAWRLTIFSLYLEILKGLSAEKINKYIKQKIEKEKGINIFPEFSENIINGNSLEVCGENLPHNTESFDFIVGNPPYFQINSNDEEIEFINNYKTEIYGNIIKATDVVGYNQMSQAFMLKIKDWANEKTKFGFVLNSSNFYNEKSEKFQDFFFNYYQVQDFYELSRVKDILFKKAKESVVVTIFNNKKVENNTVKYFPVDLELFSKTFDLLIIQEDKKIKILQREILNKTVNLRDFLIGNEFDLKLLEKLSDNKKLEEILLKDKNYNSFQGVTRHENKKIASFFNIPLNKFNKLSRKEKNVYHKTYDMNHYLNVEKSANYNTLFLYDYNLIKEFVIKKFEGYTNIELINKENFQRPRNQFIYRGNNIVFCRVGKRIKAAYCNYDKVFSVNIFGVKLNSQQYYYLLTSLLNSDLINYYINLKFKKRPNDNLPRIDKDGLKQIPIPKKPEEDLVAEITKISQQLTEGKQQYEGETKEKLNNLIYDLYDLSYLERQRIKDFFSTKKEADNNDLKKYEESLYYTLEMYFDKKPIIKFYENENLGFDIRIAAVYFNDSYKEMPSEKKVYGYKIQEILKTTDEKFLAMREKVFGKDCVYIIKDKQFKNWSETKGFEDGKNILRRLS